MKTNSSILNRSLVFAYGVGCYIASSSRSSTRGFIGDFIVPKSIDSPAVVPLWQALLVNLGLLTVFALQHSVMARPAFKRWWTRTPQVVERSTYVLFSSLALILLRALGRMGGTVWHVDHPAAPRSTRSLHRAGCSCS